MGVGSPWNISVLSGTPVFLCVRGVPLSTGPHTTTKSQARGFDRAWRGGGFRVSGDLLFLTPREAEAYLREALK